MKRLARRRCDEYMLLQDALRESRRSSTWKPEQDRATLARMEDLYASMTESEQGRVEEFGWRAWPDDDHSAVKDP